MHPMIPRYSVLVVLLTWLASTACSPLQLKPVGANTNAPAHVEVLFAATSRDVPVAGLTRDDVVVRDGALVASPDSWELHNPDMRARLQVALLVDVSGALEPEERAELASAAEGFITRLGEAPKVAVYLYDGAPSPHLVANFDAPRADALESLASIEQFEPRDDSTDLHGAFKHVLDVVEGRVAQSGVKLGAVIVVARGPDRAARIGRRALRKELDDDGEAGVGRYVITVGKSAGDAGLDWLASEPLLTAKGVGDVSPFLERIADDLTAQGRSLYLLSFCTAARAGEHELTIEVRRTAKTPDGDEVQTASLSHRFDASGFGSGCRPKVRNPAQWGAKMPEAPPPQEDSLAGEPKKKQQGTVGRRPRQMVPAPRRGAPGDGPDLRLEPAN